ncbi:hypothetical protein [Crenobacter cavernae]|uniref:Uncharacterized protein n=1 Tax=Crenobacter cavernae TaxID=2290923 RepID=A0A345Y6Q6_9NEIS|nr:hypothetical protein [Crenobacter cavernae]AXK39608.1 hypothetical protein DWG20_09220 [Crenobacter cavernae]
MVTLIFLLASLVVLWQALTVVNTMSRCTTFKVRLAYCALAAGAFGNVCSLLAGIAPSLADAAFVLGACGVMLANQRNACDIPPRGQTPPRRSPPPTVTN